MTCAFNTVELDSQAKVRLDITAHDMLRLTHSHIWQ